MFKNNNKNIKKFKIIIIILKNISHLISNSPNYIGHPNSISWNKKPPFFHYSHDLEIKKVPSLHTIHYQVMLQ